MSSHSTDDSRPAKLTDIVGKHPVIRTLEQGLRKGRLPHLLFYGPPGTGKTSTILAVARQMYPDTQRRKKNVLELNASEERGINVVRNKIKTFTQQQTLSRESKHSFRLVILDEVDAVYDMIFFFILFCLQVTHAGPCWGGASDDPGCSKRPATHHGRISPQRCPVLLDLQLQFTHHQASQVEMLCGLLSQVAKRRDDKSSATHRRPGVFTHQ